MAVICEWTPSTGNQCVICFSCPGEDPEKEPFLSHDGKHFFHKYCLNNWFFRSWLPGRKICCPVCEIEISFKNPLDDPRVIVPRFYRAIEKAILQEDVPAIRKLLRNKISNEIQGQALIFATLQERLPIIRTLLQDGQISDDDQLSALAYAMEKGDQLAVDELVQHGTLSSLYSNSVFRFFNTPVNPLIIFERSSSLRIMTLALSVLVGTTLLFWNLSRLEK